MVSLPASDTTGSPHTQADDVEVGGERGREALDRLRNVVGRVESSWRPASAEEGFEIVRRRLFEPLAEPDAVQAARRGRARLRRPLPHAGAEFPPECRDGDYEQRIQAAYPIHPEIFDRLYTDWSTLVKFQRTRGVLRLMAAVIHSLWEKGDRNPLILPVHVPIDDPRVQSELTRYLSDNWVPVIEKDVDGPNSLPLRSTARSRTSASCTRRGAWRAPSTSARRPRRPRRTAGSRIAGSSSAASCRASRRRCSAMRCGGWQRRRPTSTRTGRATGTRPSRPSPSWPRTAPSSSSAIPTRWRRSWTSGCAPTCARPATSRASIRCRARAATCPTISTRGWSCCRAEHPYTKEPGSAAETAARAILESRGNTPRLYRNTLVFLAADKVRLQDLDEAVRRFLAWESIVEEKKALNLDPHQVRQAETQKQAADGAVTARLPETYQWLLVPEQANPQAPITWQAIRLSGGDALAVRASKKLRSDESAGDLARLDDPAQAPGRRAALARRPRRGQAARGGLRALSLPAAACRARGAGAGDPRRRWRC